MKASEVLEVCRNVLRKDQERGTTVELFERCFPNATFGDGSFDDLVTTMDNIDDIDRHTNAAITEKMNRSLMDLIVKKLTVGELLICRLRMENAVRMLTVLSGAKVEVSVGTTSVEEALLWALTTLWSVGRIQWACHTAQAFAQGLPSAMPGV